ncbi:type 2 lanthipeptide synthetase LanM family protein [Krasilnikovia cinnamomea]|uniref:type 2 lanthipeptide synthetase LanM family protein n=1 Tax=Krasilnikovia cinnamomea TaxID=349313 RepID=UPI001A92CA09|nr:type 2 lanthipeptide synthetase LanM family protein [Krasilnikovia cinnamomea]
MINTADLPPRWWAAGRNGADRLATSGRPDWAHLVERAVAGAPTRAVAGRADDDWREAFAGALRPLVDVARDRVERRVAATADVDLAAVCARWAAGQGRRLATLAARTLVLELHEARQGGRLAGATGPERFAAFAAALGTRFGLAGLFGRYPVLARLLGQQVLDAADALAETIERYAADRSAIRRLRGDADPGPLTEVQPCGDPHAGGRTVALLRFAGGATVVYKPRPLTLHRRFNDLVGWLNNRVTGLDLATVATVTRPGYGWQEYVRARPCADAAEVGLFYRRQGALLALLYALDGTDMHCENVLACGAQPLLVDVETLFHPDLLPPSGAGPDPAARALTRSVRRTGLLPTGLPGEHGAVDRSGLGGERYPAEVVTWADPGTDRMRLVRRVAPVAAADNRPRLGERAQDPGAHHEDLLAGFRAAYDAIAAHGDELVDRLSGCAAAPMRVVARPSEVYARLLDESTHPDVLRDARDRDRAFALLWDDSAEDPERERLVPAELDDLWRGDVPLFTGRADSRDLWTADGRRLPAALPVTGLSAAVGKIRAMGPRDRREQEWVIAASLATRTGTVRHDSLSHAPARPPSAWSAAAGRGGDDDGRSPGRLLAAAERIAAELADSAHRDGQRANWAGLVRLDNRHWALAPLSAGLGEGYPGIALFLAELSALTGERRYDELVRAALHPVPRLLHRLAGDQDLIDAVGCGFFEGLGGIAYVLARTATLLRDAELGRWCAAAVELTADVRTDDGDDERAGLAAGLAGGLVAMRAVHAQTGLPSAGRLADAFAARLPELPAPPGAGLPWGAVGVAWALRGHAAVDRLATHAVPPAPAVGRAAAAGTDGPVSVGWCGALAGAALTDMDGAAAHRYVAAVAGAAVSPDLSLCHGELGVVEVLTALDGAGLPGARAARERRTDAVLTALERGRAGCGTPGGVPSPGLFTGLAGLGYGLLRIGYGERVPSVLLR